MLNHRGLWRALLAASLCLASAASAKSYLTVSPDNLVPRRVQQDLERALQSIHQDSRIEPCVRILDRLPEGVSPTEYLNNEFPPHFGNGPGAQDHGLMAVILGRTGGMIHRLGDAAARRISDRQMGALYPVHLERFAREGDFATVAAVLTQLIGEQLRGHRHYVRTEDAQLDNALADNLNLYLERLHWDTGVETCLIVTGGLPPGFNPQRFLAARLNDQFPQEARARNAVLAIILGRDGGMIHQVGRGARGVDTNRLGEVWSREAEPDVKAGQVAIGLSHLARSIDAMARVGGTAFRAAPGAVEPGLAGGLDRQLVAIREKTGVDLTVHAVRGFLPGQEPATLLNMLWAVEYADPERSPSGALVAVFGEQGIVFQVGPGVRDKVDGARLGQIWQERGDGPARAGNLPYALAGFVDGLEKYLVR